jgi:hypothetical protein
LQLKEINSRLDKIEPNAPSSDGARMQCNAKKSVSAPRRGSPKKKRHAKGTHIIWRQVLPLAFWIISFSLFSTI